MKPCLYLVIPCYNEEHVLSISSKLFIGKINTLVKKGTIDRSSRILFVNDGSSDDTWKIINDLSSQFDCIIGISLARNYGHQNALLAGLSESVDKCDITISIDCDGQDDINAIDNMIDAYNKGNDIVYGVRNDRKSDSVFKRTSAQLYYRFLSFMGAKVVYNHADYRLLSNIVVKELMKYNEVNLYLRGIIPLLGYNSTSVYYSRNERLAGKTHYPLIKMISLAIEGITSFSVRPLRIIVSFGLLVALLSLFGVVWTITSSLMGKTVEGWASMTCIICFIGGIQLISLGVVGEYIGKIYLETKNRPKYNIIKRTSDK